MGKGCLIWHVIELEHFKVENLKDLQWEALRLVFTSDGVGVRVIIRSMECYDLPKTRLLESQALFWYQTVI